MQIDTFLVGLPEDWSDYLTTAQVQSYITVFGPTAARTKIVSYIVARKNLVQNLNSQAAKKMYTPTVDPRTVYYNKKPAQPVSKPVLGKGKKLTGNYIVMDDNS